VREASQRASSAAFIAAPPQGVAARMSLEQLVRRAGNVVGIAFIPYPPCGHGTDRVMLDAVGEAIDWKHAHE